jgi:hypothetical protein
MGKESNIQSKILKDLRSLKDCVVFKIHKTSDNGIPDICFTSKKTGAVFIEVKSPGKKPSKLQINKINKINKSGSKAFYCDSWDSWMEVRDILNIPK